MKYYKHYRKSEILSFLRLYHESGMSQRGFCRLHDISSSTLLKFWLSKYELREKEIPLRQEESVEDMSNRSKDSYKEENAELKKRVKSLEKALEFSKLETEVRDLMINRAEEYFDIPIRKKFGAK